MAADVVQPVVLDATVLSNFASTDTVDHLVSILARPVVVPAVRDELEEGYEHGHGFLSNVLTHLENDLLLLDVEEASTGAKIRNRLDGGEAASLLVAIEQEGTLATDDLAARHLAVENGVPVTGSIGLLAICIQQGVIDYETADSLLDVWRDERGYYAPIDDIEDLFG